MGPIGWLIAGLTSQLAGEALNEWSKRKYGHCLYCGAPLPDGNFTHCYHCHERLVPDDSPGAIHNPPPPDFVSMETRIHDALSKANPAQKARMRELVETIKPGDMLKPANALRVLDALTKPEAALKCPDCHGTLPDWNVRKCCHCGSVVDPSAQLAQIQAEKAAERATREKEAAERAARERAAVERAAVERAARDKAARERAAAESAAVERAAKERAELFRARSRKIVVGAVRACVGIPMYRLALRVVGKENTIVAVFFSVLGTIAIYGALVVVLVFSFRSVSGGTRPSARDTIRRRVESPHGREAVVRQTSRAALQSSGATQYRPPPPIPTEHTTPSRKLEEDGK